MTLQSKTARRPVKQYEGANPAAPRAIASHHASAIAMLEDPAIAKLTAIPPRTSSARIPSSPHADEAHGRRIRESARGETCLVRYVGICSHDPAKTIWSHARWGAQLGEGGRGMGTKADDLAGAYACGDCDAAFDQMVGAEQAGYTREALDLDWMMGHLRSLGILTRKGLL